MSNNYYTENAHAFFESTVSVDMTPIYNKFLPVIKKNGHILDAGCGSGRDAKAFLAAGYKVTAFDASEALTNKASAFLGQPVELSTFETFVSTDIFDGIWACASLLHVPSDNLPAIFSKFASLLTNDGLFYCSFKYGEGEVERGGRKFTNLNEVSIVDMLKETGLAVKHTWVTGDRRADRHTELWLNALLEKE